MVPLKAQVVPILSIATGQKAYVCTRFDGYSIRYISNHPNRQREHQQEHSAITRGISCSKTEDEVKRSSEHQEGDKQPGWVHGGCTPCILYCLVRWGAYLIERMGCRAIWHLQTWHACPARVHIYTMNISEEERRCT